MAFVFIDPNQCAATGSVQQLTLLPSANTVGALAVQIVGAAYGNDASDVVIAPGGQSITLTVQAGIDNLVLTVVSPNPIDGALLDQGGTIFEFLLTNHWAGCNLPIKGS